MHIQKEFKVSIGGGDGSFRYLTSDEDAVGRQLFWTGLSRWESESWREFIPFARSARGFLDIGAFTGCYSLVAATVNRSIQTLAFEPVPSVYERLVRNVEINGLTRQITTIAAAVSATVGSERFYIPDRALPDTSFLASSLRATEEDGTWHEVATTTICAALPPGFHVDLVKIDVEDAEGPVVDAMVDVLREHRPIIFIEFLASGSYAQAAGTLAGLGYSFFHLTDKGRVPIERPDPKPRAKFINYLCLPSSHY